MANSAAHICEKAAHFRELAKLIASERVECELLKFAADLEAKANVRDAELAQKIKAKRE